MGCFSDTILDHFDAPLTSEKISTVQVNMGLRCNLSCAHCHLGCNNKRTEQMSKETLELILSKVATREGLTFDLTGGSPELNPHLEWFITKLKGLGQNVKVRTNLAVLSTGGKKQMPAFYRDHNVALVASLPCYLQENVDAQRGDGTFIASMAALKELSSLGYGSQDGPSLDLVFNPMQPTLPPDQTMLEAAYKSELAERYGVRFTNLLTITNMPIGRFLDDLESDGKANSYRELLKNSFNPMTVDGLMCRHQISIRWNGMLSDCDFNQALALGTFGAVPKTVEEFNWESIDHRPIVVADHCFGCTAGSGSSCGGALVDESEAAACAGG